MQVSTIATLKNIIKEPVFANDLERQFAMKYVHVTEHHNAAFWHLCHAAYWPVALLSGAVFSFDKAVMMVMALVGLPTSILSLFIHLKVKSTIILRRSQILLYIICNVISLASTRADVLDGIGHRGVAAYWILGAFLGIGFLAYRNYAHIVCIVLILVMTWFGFRDYPEPLVGMAVMFALIMVSSNTQVLSHRALKMQAIETFRLQAQFTPKHMILASLDQNMPIQELFAPKERDGVYICADWRSFQDWCKRVDPGVISTALREYFDALILELNTLLPEGNFFADWIADELFVAMFTTEVSDEAVVATRAIAFAEKIIDIGSASRAKFGAPLGVDVGVSCGKTIMGILGPTASMKATALGEVAGEARRLQTLGKEIRMGGRKDEDHIVISALVARHIDAAGAGFVLRHLKGDITIKDLDAPAVYVKKRAPQPSAPIEQSQAA